MKNREKLPKFPLFPQTAGLNSSGRLTIGGCDTVALAAKYGTPLCIFDEATLRSKCAEYRHEFESRYPNTLVIYACKAFINSALALILQEEHMGLDVVSGGEIAIAKSVAFSPEKVFFHGNNKSADELKSALEWGIGRIVVDNFHELHLLGKLAKDRGRIQDILLRVSPGVDPHTHKYITTGVLDSKFGFPLTTGQAEEALVEAMATPSLHLVGLHFHLGSSIFEIEPYVEAIEIVLRFAVQMKEKHNLDLRELNIGGGFAVQYQMDSPAPSIGDYAEAITSKVLSLSRKLKLDPLRLIVEPGRTIVAQAGVSLYKVGGTKEIPGVRKYVFVDGGMGDNIRPALYGSRYDALVANKAGEDATEMVTVAGKFCESGDILIKDIRLPKLEEGDIIAMPTSGAYSIPMSSNYNASLRPAILMIKDRQARLIRRRETYEDLLRYDVL